jgi:four helix bundle protein
MSYQHQHQHQLLVVEKSKQLVRMVYKIVKKLPKEEKYIIIPQILRAVISIPSNIVEGQQRTDKDFKRFISISRGSLYEVKMQLEIISHEYNIDTSDEMILIDEIGKMTHGLMLKLTSDAASPKEVLR